MLRILIFLLCVPVFAPLAHGAIEIYVNGHKYDSMQAYLDSKKPIAARPSLIPVTLNKQQENDIRKEAQQLGINVDFSKVKSIQIAHNHSYDTIRHKLDVLSVENGMVSALQDFYTQGTAPGRSITPEQLQQVIQQALTASKEPKLLISEPGKVSIMTLSSQDPGQ